MCWITKVPFAFAFGDSGAFEKTNRLIKQTGNRKCRLSFACTPLAHVGFLSGRYISARPSAAMAQP